MSTRDSLPGRECAFDGCNEQATTRVRWVLGVEEFCEFHGRYVAMVEREWDEAEAEMLEQP